MKRMSFLARPAACLGVFVACALPDPAAAQLRLTNPESVFPEDFGSIQTVRELADGRVLVADPLSRALYAVDMARGTRTVIGRQGQGPDEYMQPDAVWPLPGDSTLLVDLGNGRLTTLAPDLSFRGTVPIASGDPRPGAAGGFMAALPQAVDGRGRIYARALGTGAGPGTALPDSGAVLRMDRAARVADTVATVKLQERSSVTSGGANDRNVRIQPVPLSPEDAWGVAADGTVVVARVGSSRVEWLEPGGRVTRGSVVTYPAVRIGTPEKEEWQRAQDRSGGGIGVAISIQNGAVSTTFARGGMGGMGGPNREIDQYDWPERMPPFQASRVLVDPAGRAWVARHVPAGRPAAYDLFDRSGSRVSTVELDAGSRVVGFGRTHVYVVSFDDFDLNYLERYTIP